MGVFRPHLDVCDIFMSHLTVVCALLFVFFVFFALLSDSFCLSVRTLKIPKM